MRLKKDNVSKTNGEVGDVSRVSRFVVLARFACEKSRFLPENRAVFSIFCSVCVNYVYDFLHGGV